MKVILAGASGTLGRPLMAALRSAGHEIVGITRTAQGAERISARGGQPIIADVMDRDAILRAFTGVRADAVLHELTALKKAPARFSQMNETNRLRIQGTTNLLEVAREAGATRFVTQSIVFGYGYRDVGRVDETDAFGTLAGDATDSAIHAMVSTENQTFNAPGIDGIALRYGLLYGEDVATMVRMLNRRGLPVPTKWRGTLGLIHHADAASATVAALEHGTDGRAYNIVDDTPISWRDYIQTVAGTHRAKSPLAMPDALLRVVAPYAAALMTRINMTVSNQRAREELRWAPRFPSVADGLKGIG